jgi:hypothetical protein
LEGWALMERRVGGRSPGFRAPQGNAGKGREACAGLARAGDRSLACGGVFTSVRNVAAAEAQRAEGGPNLYFWYLVACGVAYASGVGPFLCSPNRKGGIAWRSALALFVISLPLEGSVVLSILALETIEASDMAIIMSLNLVLTLAVRAWVRRWVPPPTLAAVACGVCATVAAWTLRDGHGASAALRPGHGVACLALAMRAASAVALERALDPARGVAWCNHYSALARVAGGGGGVRSRDGASAGQGLGRPVALGDCAVCGLRRGAHVHVLPQHGSQQACLRGAVLRNHSPRKRAARSAHLAGVGARGHNVLVERRVRDKPLPFLPLPSPFLPLSSPFLPLSSPFLPLHFPSLLELRVGQRLGRLASRLEFPPF